MNYKSTSKSQSVLQIKISQKQKIGLHQQKHTLKKTKSEIEYAYPISTTIKRRKDNIE